MISQMVDKQQETQLNTVTHNLFSQLNKNNKPAEVKNKIYLQNQNTLDNPKTSSLKAPIGTKLSLKGNFKLQSDNSLLVVKNALQSENTNTTTCLSQKPKRTLKDMFSKVVNISTDENQQKKKDVSQSRLAKLLNEVDAEPPADINKCELNSKGNKSDSILGKATYGDSNIISTFCNSNGNNESLFKVKVNKEDKKIELKENVNSQMKKFVFNIIMDETNIDDYKCTTFYFKAGDNDANKEEIKDINQQINTEGK